LAVYSEKRPDAGEDAVPSFVRHDAGGQSDHQRRRLIAVYDGLGGAGSVQVPLRDGTVVSQAYLASRLTRMATERWYRWSVDRGKALAPEALQHWIHWHLAAVAEALPERRSNVRSRLQRTLPTTLAVATVIPKSGRRRFSGSDIAALWVGDSRVYLLTPSSGLQQLSADDVRSDDVLDQLVNDSRMTQVVSAASDWSVASSSVSIDEPFVVLCATDGVHAYVKTPGVLEYVLLSTLQQATSVEDWGLRLLASIGAYTGDDATLVLSAVGFTGLPALRSAFAHRAEMVRESQHEPFRHLPADDDGSALRARRVRAWEFYRADYTARMPRSRTERS
jgi:serine/threonine protein phosphatase PrpC